MILESIRISIANLLHFHKEFQDIPSSDLAFDLHNALCAPHPPERHHVVLCFDNDTTLRIQLRKVTDRSSAVLFYLAVTLRSLFHEICLDADVWDTARTPIDGEKKWWSVGEEILREVNVARKTRREELLIRVPGHSWFSEERIQHYVRRWEKLNFHTLITETGDRVQLSPPVYMQLLGSLIELHGRKKTLLFLPDHNSSIYSMASRGNAELHSNRENIDQLYADINLMCAVRRGSVMRHQRGPLWTYTAFHEDRVVFGHAFFKDPTVEFTMDVVVHRNEVLSRESYEASHQAADQQEEKENQPSQRQARSLDC